MMETHIVRKKKKRKTTSKKDNSNNKTHRNNYAIIWKWTQKNGVQSDLRECYCYFGDFSASKPSSTSQPLLFFCALLRFPSCWMPFEFKILTVLIFFKPRKKKPKHLTVIADQSMSVNNYPDFFSLRRVWNLSDEKKINSPETNPTYCYKFTHFFCWSLGRWRRRYICKAVERSLFNNARHIPEKRERGSRERSNNLFLHSSSFDCTLTCAHYDTLYRSDCLASNVMHACISATVDSAFVVQFIVRLWFSSFESLIVFVCVSVLLCILC